MPKNALFGYSPDAEELVASPAFKKLQALGKPLFFTWEEFGWESPEQPAYLTAPAKYKALAEQVAGRVRHAARNTSTSTATEAKETIYLPMDAWNKSLTWGLGGDQVRILDRKVEGAAAGRRTSSTRSPRRWARRSQASCWTRRGKTCWPRRATTWGCASTRAGKATAWRPPTGSRTTTTSPGARSATTTSTPPRNRARQVLDASLGHIAKRINSAARQARPDGGHRLQSARLAADRSGAHRPDLPDRRRRQQGVVVKDRAGQRVPSQIVKSERTAQGNLIVADVAFPADKVPSVGYDTYYLDFTPQAAPPAPTDCGSTNRS